MKVITKINNKIMMEISKDLTRKWSINQLAKTIKKHYRPVYAATQRLVKFNYLKKNRNKLIEPVISNSFLLEIAEKTRLDKQKKTIRLISKKLHKHPSKLFSAVLFGSSIKKKGRDYDILVIVPDCESVENYRKSIAKSLGSFSSEVDLNVVHEKSCYEMLNRPNQINVMNEILKNHLVLYGVEIFYNILKNWKND